MLIPGHRAAVPQTAHPTPISLPFTTLRHRGIDSHGVHPPPPDGIYFHDGSMPPELLE